MCACEPSWTCPRCRDTPSDHRYELDEPEPRTDETSNIDGYDEGLPE